MLQGSDFSEDLKAKLSGWAHDEELNLFFSTFKDLAIS